MKTVAALALSLLLTPAAFAQSTPPSIALPPPGMNDPGVKAAVPARPSTLPAVPAARGNPAPGTPALPAMQEGPRDALGEVPPEVRVHQEGDDTVQEYTRNGQLYMVVITPKGGVAQTYMVDPQGRLVDEHGQRPVRPVMYKVLEWGKSKPAEPAEPASGD